MTLKISFIGFGNMATAIAQGLSSLQHIHMKAACPSGKSAMKNIELTKNNLTVVPDADVIILAVKPAVIAEVLTEISAFIPKDCLIISLAAGISLDYLTKYTPKNQALIRSMPNTPAAMGQGATPLIANNFTSKQHKDWAQLIFSAVGIYRWVDNEDMINAYTALSGSGPAYVFLFMQAMSEAATILGIPADDALAFTLQTVQGAVSLAQQNNMSLEDLRLKVTSPAGTTAAGVAQMQAANISEIMSKTLEAAYARALELGKH